MFLDAENRTGDQVDQKVLQERAQSPSASPSPQDTTEADGLAADTGVADVRGRAPAPQERRSDERPAVDSPPLHDDQAPGESPQGADAPRARFIRRHTFAAVFGLLLCIPVAAGGYLYWDNAQHFESTDDAYIATRQFSVAPELSGYITAVPVTDNQHVAAGGVIARIDDRSFRISLDQTKAQLAHDQSLLAQAQKNLSRYRYLAKTNSIAQQQVDDQTYLVAQDKATVALDQAKVDAAKLNLSYTTVSAAQAGRVVSLTAAVGQYAQPGTALTILVPDDIWVTANFKETQLDAMRPGQPVTLTIDAYPDRTLRGHVASVQPGSGPAFSLLPPENATGNWVKIVQRVPVKIVMDDPPTDIALGPGMSVETTVRANPSPSLYERFKAWL